MRKIGVTGGIGSGKSFVCQLLTRHFGIPVYDCDYWAKWLTQHDDHIRQGLTRLIGSQVFDAQGRTNKAVFADYLFRSDEHAARVNALIHPVVRRHFRSWTQQQDAPVVALESAILYECGFDSEVDEVLLVTASLQTRLLRAMQRDGATREQIEQRMLRQDDTIARSRAARTLVNEKETTEETIIKQIKNWKLC